MNRHDIRRVLLIAGILMLALAAVPALAKGKPSAASVSVDGVNPHAEFGQEVTVTVETTVTKPFVNIQCSQDGKLVYSQTRGMFDGYFADPVFTLGPTQNWSGGDADCTAELGYKHKRKWRTLATYEFTTIDDR